MAGLEDASTLEEDPEAATPLITLASCPVENRPDGAPRLFGKLEIRVGRDSAAFRAYRKTRIEESFTCNYELNPAYRKALESKGLRVTGVSEDGGARIVELFGHRFFVGTGFVPQFSSEPGKPHPLILAYLEATVRLK